MKHFFLLQVEQRIPKVSKKSVLMDEETELTVKKTTECEGKNRRDDPSPGNTEPFFFTQVSTCPVSLISILLPVYLGSITFFNLWVYSCLPERHGELGANTVSLSLFWMLLPVQAADVSEYEFDLGAGEREAAEGEDGTVPEKCDYCKMLMDAKPNPGVAEPFGEDCSFTCSCLFLSIFIEP